MREKDKLERTINSFATQSFRDQADRDYITARLACRYELYPQFLWASLQAVEKYLKAILLYNRIEAKDVKHDLTKALTLTSQLPFELELSPRSKEFITHLSSYGEFRYIDVPYYVNGYLLIDLDLTIWEIRRYYQTLNVMVEELLFNEQTLLEEAKINLEKSKSEPRHKFRLHEGLLEKILYDRKHPSRPALLWQNAVYSVRRRPVVRVKNHLHFQNPILCLYPEALDELLKYIFIPDKLAKHYRQQLKNKISEP